VQIFYDKYNSYLIGLKFLGKNGEVLLDCGDYELIYVKGEISPKIAIAELTLEKNERLVAFKSYGVSEKKA
jgi:hypothetical protein